MSTATEEKPKVEEPKQPEITEAGQADLNKLARNILFGGREAVDIAPVPKEEPDPAKPAEPAPEPVKTPKPRKKAAKPPEQPAREPETSRVDSEALISRTAEATARAVSEAMKPKPEPVAKPKADDWADLPLDDRRKLPVLQRMSFLFPERYPEGFAEKYMASLRKAAEYEKKWRKDHPDEEYDPQAEEHNAFFEGNSIDWSDEDEAEARADIVAERRLKPEVERTRAELEELRRKELQRETQPVAIAESKRVANDIFKRLGGDYKDLLTPEGFTKKDVLDKIKAADPLEADVVFTEITRREQEAVTVEQLFRGAIVFNPQDPVHAKIAAKAREMEDAIMTLPERELFDDHGRKFARTADYSEMNQATRSKHWTIEAQELNDLLTAKAEKEIQAAVAAQRKLVGDYVSRYGFVPAKNGNGTLPAQPVPVVEKPKVEDFAPRQVTTKGVTIPGGATNKNTPPSETDGSLLLKKILGR